MTTFFWIAADMLIESVSAAWMMAKTFVEYLAVTLVVFLCWPVLFFYQNKLRQSRWGNDLVRYRVYTAFSLSFSAAWLLLIVALVASAFV